MGVYVLGEPGAVELIGAVAAQHIRGSQILLCVGHDLRAQIAAGCFSRIGLSGNGDIVAAYVTGLSRICNFIPAVIHALQFQNSTAGNGSHGVVAGTCSGTHVQGGAVGIHQSVTKRSIGGGGDSEVLAGHIPLDGIEVDLVPTVTGVLQHHDAGAAGCGGEDLSLCGGGIPQAKRVGRDGAGTQGGGGRADGKHCGEYSTKHGCTQQVRWLYHR